MTFFRWIQECFFREAMQIIPDNPTVIKKVEEREHEKNGQNTDCGAGSKGADWGQRGHEPAAADGVQKRTISVPEDHEALGGCGGHGPGGPHKNL
ncbi:hypothetical protein [uncultured Intestinimonas sp.]|uniref:hypothetical protein n=1 Tax=uncultured Intestinimonas sp. TaxID=1689265 RepID=UPI0025F1AE3A|nr:hypothetical protein [uncultured Intestinimonas sp.]